MGQIKKGNELDLVSGEVPQEWFMPVIRHTDGKLHRKKIKDFFEQIGKVLTTTSSLPTLKPDEEHLLYVRDNGVYAAVQSEVTPNNIDSFATAEAGWIWKRYITSGAGVDRLVDLTDVDIEDEDLIDKYYVGWDEEDEIFKLMPMPGVLPDDIEYAVGEDGPAAATNTWQDDAFKNVRIRLVREGMLQHLKPSVMSSYYSHNKVTGEITVYNMDWQPEERGAVQFY